MKITEEILAYIKAHEKEAYELLVTLAQIPAPSGHEEKRAAFCKEWLEAQGAKGVYIDEALNVIYPIACEGDRPIAVFMAHSDVVFPDTEPLPLKAEDGKIFCPGIGDDTANVAALLMAAKYLTEADLRPQTGLLLVVNSGEEGLGNLKGSRKIVEDFGHRICELVTFDGGAKSICNRAVGSKRYRVELRTEGGHSYGAFGNRNAIVYLASLIETLYAVKVPPLGKTTYNVGVIEGGTSVNTIAEEAHMLYEFRSDERESLRFMEEHFYAAIALYRAKGVEVSVTLVGDRPCMGEVDKEKQAALEGRGAEAVSRHYGFTPVFRAGSTDCNIPLSVGIPSICVGCVLGAGAHTRGELVYTDSLLPGIATAFELILHHV